MPESTYTTDWNAGAGSWSLGTGVSAEATDGWSGAASDPGCLKAVVTTGEARPVAPRTITLTGLDWEDLGVTPGDLVTEVRASLQLKLVSTSGVGVPIAVSVAVRRTSDSGLIATAYSDSDVRAVLPLPIWQPVSGSDASVGMSDQASTTGIYLEVTVESDPATLMYGWELRLDTLVLTVTATPDPGGIDSGSFPVESVSGFPEGSAKGSSLGEGSFANYQLAACPIVIPTAGNWVLTVFTTLGSGVSATLRVYTLWNGDGTYVEAALSAGLNTVTLPIDADQLTFLNGTLRFGGAPLSIVINKTAGTNNASVSVLEFDCELTGPYPSDTLYPWGYPPPEDFTIDGTWVTDSGPPMQGEAVTLFYTAIGRRLNLSDPNGIILRVAHTFTDGTGNFSFSFRDWAGRAWVVPGWWYQKRVAGVFSIEPVLNTNLGARSHPALLSCTSPWVFDEAQPQVGPNAFMPRLWCFATYVDTPDFLNGTHSIGTVETDYRPKIHAVGSCGDGGRYNLAGITFDVVGAFGTESVTTDSDGMATLTQVDPQAILDIANVSGLPSCGSMNTEPPYTQPAGIRRGTLTPDFVFSNVTSRPDGAQYGAWGIPPLCGDNYWEGAYVVCVTCGGAMPSMRLNADTHDPTGQIAVAWISDTGALRVAVNPQPLTCVEQADGGNGWKNVVTLESSNASDVGLVFLQDGRLFVRYDLSGAKKYRTTDRLAHGDLASWSSAATPSPAVSRHSDQHRGQGQAHIFRALGGSPDAWTGAGDIEFSQCRDNTGAAFTSPVTVVTGARGLYCGGGWIEGGYGCLYRKDSDGKAYWKTTANPEDWGAGSGTDVSAEISLLPIGLARHPSGTLCALTWDATGTKQCRTAVSNGRGESWEESVSDIDVIPPLTHPPAIVCVGGVFFAIWVANDTPVCAYSTDGGITWGG